MFIRLVACVLAGMGAFALNGGAATLVGSDLLKGPVSSAIIKDMGTQTTSTVNLEGSLLGEKNLRAGKAEAALLLLPDRNKVPEIAKGEWEAVPVAYQVVAVVVNKRNALEELDLATLAGIYGQLQEADIKHWSTVKNSALDVPIYCVSTRYDIGMVTPLFRKVVLNGGDYRREMNFMGGDAEAQRYVTENVGAIALLALPPEGDQVKTLRVKATKEGNAYAPDASNLYNSDYPIAIPLYLVFPKAKQSAMRPLVAPVFSDATAAALQETGFMPVPKNIRANAIQRLDKKS